MSLLEESREVPPNQWRPMVSAPKDGTLLDVLFDIRTAEPGMAEFYVPGCTRKKEPEEPIIENVAFVNGNFAPVIDAEGGKVVAALKGDWGDTQGSTFHSIMRVSLTHWRPASSPYIE